MNADLFEKLASELDIQAMAFKESAELNLRDAWEGCEIKAGRLIAKAIYAGALPECKINPADWPDPYSRETPEDQAKWKTLWITTRLILGQPMRVVHHADPAPDGWKVTAVNCAADIRSIAARVRAAGKPADAKSTDGGGPGNLPTAGIIMDAATELLIAKLGIDSNDALLFMLLRNTRESSLNEAVKAAKTCGIEIGRSSVQRLRQKYPDVLGSNRSNAATHTRQANMQVRGKMVTASDLKNMPAE